MDRVGCIVVGAGVVGLAVARALALRGTEVIIAEKADAIGTETSSRNSEVIHAGIYYAPGSLKARLCATGRGMLYDYAAGRGVPHRRCGKLIVATAPEQLAVLDSIAGHAAANGVALTMLTGAQAMELEPALSCHGALLSPETGIVDSHALMEALLADAEGAGAMLALGTQVVAIEPASGGFIVDTETDGERFRLAADMVVNAAGLWASQVAQAVQGLDPAHVPVTRYARGSYYAAPGRPAFSRLIYPVPEPGGLGVHLTLDLGGSMRFGPDVEWIDGIDYRVNPDRQAHFEAEMFGREVNEGMVVPRLERRAPAGMICTAVSLEGMTATDGSLVRGAARAGATYGVPVFIRCGSDAPAELQLAIEESMQPDRVVIAGLDRRDAVARGWPLAVAQAGACVGIDHVGSTDPFYVSDAERVALVLDLIGAGHADRIVLSSSATGVAFGEPGNDLPFATVLTTFVPMLEQAGVSRDLIDQILITNPARLLSVGGEA